VLLNNHPSQHIHQSAPVPLPLISSRLLKHRTTRSSNAEFVCRAELFCSRCQTRVHPFTEEEISTALQKTKPATAPDYDDVHVEFLKNLASKLAPVYPNSSPESWLPIPPHRSGERPR